MIKQIWLRAAMLVCTTVWMISCSTDDNAVIRPADGPARILLAGLLSDTRNLTKTSTQHEDSVAWTALELK
jgi:hypothetical protein